MGGKKKQNFVVMKRNLFYLSVLMTIAFSTSYASDFNAVSSSGHTLYYNIINASAHTVAVTYPGVNGSYWTGYTKPAGNIVIPSSVTHGGDSYSVTTICDDAFYECNNITGVTFPNTIVSLGNSSFYMCSNITSVSIPSSVKRIGWGCFGGCPLANVSVPNSVEWMGAGAFGDINHWSNITWDDNLSDGVVYLGKIAYTYKGTMPTNTSITLASDTKGIAGRAFYQQSNMTNISLPSSLLSIGEESFYGCGGIQSITIPASVKQIGYRAFGQCGVLATVNYNAINASTMGDLGYSSLGVFMGCDIFATLNIGSSVQAIPANIFRGCTHIAGQINLPSSTRKIGEYAFYGCTSITSVTIPSNVDTIENWPFYGCTALTTVHYNATNCHNTYDCPFSGCTSLTTIVFGSGVQIIPDYLCNNITSLNGTLNLPNNLKKIGISAFHACSGISGSLIIPNSVRRICISAFSNCTGITSVTIGTNLDTLEAAFSGTTSISSITYNAINCTNGPSSWLFTGNVITSLSINSNVQSIPDYFIGTCPNLTTVTFPSTLSRIGANNFYNCGLVGTLTLPSSITEIGYGAFTLCSNLSGIQCNASTPPTVPSMYGMSYIFTGCWNIPLYVPCSSVTAYQSAPGWSNFTNISGIGGCNYTVTLSVNNSAMGTVSGGGIYTQGATATITATAYNGYHFDHWSDGNTQNPRMITINSNITLTAYFAQNTQYHTVTLSSNDYSMGTVTGGGQYEHGSLATCAAVPYNGYHFERWSDNNTQNPRNITVNSDITLTAYFAANAGIDDIDDAGINVYTKDYQIYIDEAIGEEVSVYTIDGRAIASLPRATEHVAIPVTTVGVYLVKIGNHPARKVVVIR